MFKPLYNGALADFVTSDSCDINRTGCVVLRNAINV